jgi:hypothetical protein
MKTFDCEQILSHLDEFIDDSMAASDATAVRSHLEACPSCRAEVESVRSLLAEARSLRRSIEPERDLWPEIAGGIKDRQVVRGSFDRSPVSTSRRLWLAAAAAAILVVSVSIAYLAGLERGRPESADLAPAGSSQSYTKAAYGDLAGDLEQTRDQLRASLEKRQDELSPETWSVVVDNLDVIDTAIGRIETALADNPNDSWLNRQLTVAYRRQIDLLQRANRLPAEV